MAPRDFVLRVSRQTGIVHSDYPWVSSQELSKRLRVGILSRDAAHPVDRALIEQRLAAALALRTRLGAAPYSRWVFGESDGLPGLVLDRYGDVVVGQGALREIGIAVKAGFLCLALHFNDLADSFLIA